MKINSVSVVIPCRNEEKYIAKCLESIIDSNFEKKLLEVFVVDGLSTDNSKQIIEQFSSKYNWIHFIENTNQTTPYALNAGIKNSKSDVLIILGAHSEIYPDFISQNIFYLNKYPECGCVGGYLENEYENETAEIVGAAMSSVFGVGNANFRIPDKEGFVDTVAFGAYRKEVFEKVGLFDEVLTRNQDDDFNYRVTKAGYKIFLSPTIKCKYYVRASYQKLYRQYKQYGYWKVYLNKKHKAFLSIRQLIPFLFISFLVVGFLLSFFNSIIALGYWIGLIAYGSLALFFAFKKSKKNSDVLKIAFTFFLLHWAYGTGYAQGLVSFLLMNKKPTKEVQLTR
jgi:glycosyltransferase involved in cell wall biosynthesis